MSSGHTLRVDALAHALRRIPHKQRSLAIKLALVAVLLLRSRLFTIAKSRRASTSESARTEASTNSQECPILYDDVPDDENGTKILYVPFRGRISKVKITPTPAAYFDATRALFLPSQQQHDPTTSRAPKSQTAQLISLLRLAFPSVRSKQALILLLHSSFLVLRTYLSVLVARLDGRIVRDLVSANGPGFGRGLVLWFLLAIPSTYTNSMIRHLQSKLSLHLRTRLTRYAHDLYLSSVPLLRYYRVTHGAGSESLEGVDQYITADIASFCDSLAALYGNLMKPSLDLLIFTSQLSRSLGVRGTLLLFLNYYATAKILRAVTPAFGRLAAVERGLEGEFRAGMGRVGRESEEVAFYGGGPRERDILWRAYLRLIKHINSIYKIRIAYEWTEDFVIKYAWSAAGYILISIPILFTRRRSVGVQATTPPGSRPSVADDAIADRTESYISNRRLLLSLADAGGRLMYAYKDILELAGLSSRLYALFATLHALRPLPEFVRDEKRIAMRGVDVVVPGAGGEGGGLRLVKALQLDLPISPDADDGGDHHRRSNEEDDGNDSDFEPVTESGESTRSRDDDDDDRKAAKKKEREDAESWRMKPGEHLMITGPNGVGKTAIARVLAGLWPHGAAVGGGGRIERPERGVKGVFVVPQRSYMVVGSLLDQMIYPHSYAQFLRSGKTEEDLMEILRVVHLAYLPEREGGWTTRKEWRDVLSGGEKQRMGMARVFYHRPKVVILDECTSAVSSDVEGSMYQHAKDIGITLITISLRPSLAKYHTRLLSLPGDGTGSWTMTRVGTVEERMGIDREIVDLEEKLADVQKWEARVKELDVLLGGGKAGGTGRN